MPALRVPKLRVVEVVNSDYGAKPSDEFDIFRSANAGAYAGYWSMVPEEKQTV
jgi:hypothetical protein